MRHAEWMEWDERMPEQIQQDRLRQLEHEERSLMGKLEFVQSEIAQIPARKPR